MKSKDKTRKLYFCDGNAENCNKKKCYKRGGNCKLTSDINHAIEMSQEGTRDKIPRVIYLKLRTIRKELKEIKKILEPKHVDIYIGKEKMNILAQSAGIREEVKTTVKKGKMRKKRATSGCTEITIRFHQTTGTPLKEVLEEIWDLKEEHPDAKINIEVNR